MHLDRAHRLHLYPDPVLRRPSAPVAEITDETRAFVQEMFRIMREKKGFGLAAPQAGRNLRIFVTEEHEDFPARAYINPSFIALDGPVEVGEEGCLSLPDIRVHIRRPPRAAIRALDETGNLFELWNDEMMARCWQHETDHLDGILILDRMSPMDKLVTRRAVRALERGEGHA
ncbi:MAG: peptide deformylase [Planctomycetota bacterium]|nr:peptide deformylase [Planctomycetota bacterium]